MLTVLDVLIEPNAAALVDGNSLVAALENIKLVLTEFFVSRYYNNYGAGRYIRERDLDPLMHKNDQGASMQRKRICQEELSTLPTSKSLG